MTKDDKPRIKASYSGEMTPEIRAWLDQVERILNERVDVRKLVEAADRAAIEASVFGSAETDPTDFIKD